MQMILIPDRLYEIADSATDNGWATGHLVYLHSYNAGLARAEEALKECRASVWWCAALRGFALHSYGRYAASDSAFTAALAAMPESERCRWRDISSLLHDSTRTAYERLSCSDRRAVEDRLWWLADPLYMLSGNDRRTEHFSRRVIDSLFSGMPTPFHTSDSASVWNDSFRSIVMRYGMAAHWIVPGKLATYEEERVRWLHFHTPSYQFLPVEGSLDPQRRVLRDDFQLAAPLDSARERYHPEYDFVTDLRNSQTIVFPRGDSMIVAAAADFSRESYGEAAPFTVALYLARDHSSAESIRIQRNIPGRAVFAATVPRTSTMLGLEAMSHSWLVAARTRYTVVPPTRGSPLWITQPLLLSSAQSAPRVPSEAIPLMLGSERIFQGRPLGLYWEVGGEAAQQGAAAQFTIRAIRTSERRLGILQRITGVFSTVVASDTLVVRWTDVPGPRDAVSGHSIDLNLTSLTEGSYRLELVVEFPGGVQATSHRELEVVREDERPRAIIDALRQPVPRESSAAVLTPEPALRRRTGVFVPPL
jgi:hypothetical protein